MLFDSLTDFQNSGSEPSLRELFLTPLSRAFDSCRTRKCRTVQDKDYVVAGVTRTLHQLESGRGFVQWIQELFDFPMKVADYFACLRSKRRMAMTREVHAALLQECRKDLPDCLEVIPELEGREVWAGDGHFHKAPCHEKLRTSGGKKLAVGQFFALDLRVGRMAYMDLAGDGQWSEHDMGMLKRRGREVIRELSPKGTIWVWDRAAIDFGFWFNFKQSAGIYVITRAKRGLALDTVKKRVWERGDGRNRGVLADEEVRTSDGYRMRKIVVRNPEDGTIYVLLTNDMTLPPGVVSHLYRMRWNLEKVFDETRNRLGEDKAWGTTREAKMTQGYFIAMTYNLIQLLQAHLKDEDGITDEKLARRIEKELTRRQESCDQGLSKCVLLLRKSTQHSAQFIRWVRNHFTQQTSYREFLPRLRVIMSHYL